MRAFYLSPFGDDTHHGLNESRPWRTLDRLAAASLEPGDAIWLLGGHTYPGAIELFGVGDPQRQLTFASYGAGGRATIASGSRRGLWYAGPGGLVVRGLDFVGDTTGTGTSGIEAGSDNKGPCRNVVIEDVACTGYSMAGITLSTSQPMHEVTVRRCRLFRNANGLHTSAGSGHPHSRGIYGLFLSQVIAEDNDWVGDGTWSPVGHGVSLNAVSGAVVERCHLLRNGARHLGNPGHDGIMAYNCDNVRIHHCEAIGNWDLNPANGDGQGFVIDQCQDVVVEYNLSQGNMNGGFAAMSDTRPGRNERVYFLHNTSLDDVVGLMAYGDGEEVYFLHNYVRTHARDEGSYRKCLDVSDGHAFVDPLQPDRRSNFHFWGNRLVADDGAVSLEVTGPNGLRGVSGLAANEWVSAVPRFHLNGTGYTSLLALLAVVPLSDRGGA